jgi:hypothetical protein
MDKGFGQYTNLVGSNRIKKIKSQLKRMDDPEEMMILIIDTLKDVEIIPDVGSYYTFIYNAKTPRLKYDQHPLIACLSVERWGFRGLNFHWGTQRNYTWNEVAGQLHIVRKSEVNSLRDIPYAYFRTVPG